MYVCLGIVSFRLTADDYLLDGSIQLEGLGLGNFLSTPLRHLLLAAR